MEAKSFEKSLRAFTTRKPFRSFEIELISGTTLIIDHPEALVIRGGAAVHVDKENEFTLFDNSTVSKITSKKAVSSSN